MIQEVRPRTAPADCLLGIELARWGCVDGVEAPQVAGLQVAERVELDEVERVVGLLLDVHPPDLEAGPCIAHRRAAAAAEQVQQSGLHAAFLVHITDRTRFVTPGPAARCMSYRT